MAGTWIGTSNSDTILVQRFGEFSGITHIEGEGGDDVLIIDRTNIVSGLTVDGGAGNDIIMGGRGYETLLGNSGNDEVSGRGAGDTLRGGSGDDKLYSGTFLDAYSSTMTMPAPGRDYLYGDSGNDSLFAGEGSDFFFGGSGSDTLSYQTHDAGTYAWKTKLVYTPFTSGLEADLSKGTVTFGTSIDTLDSIENLIGSNLADNIKGSKVANAIDGAGGNDTIRGLGGADTLTGGAGDDTFVYLKKDHDDGSVDTILDFGNGSDKLDLRDFFKGHADDTIDEMMHVTEVEGGSMVSMYARGSFIDVVMLEGVTGLSASDMLADGMLLV